MCTQWFCLYACGHKGFYRYDPCQDFGTKCYGAGGEQSLFSVENTCDDCQSRATEPNPEGRKDDPYLKEQKYVPWIVTTENAAAASAGGGQGK
ncbi:hypothetical protein NEUTE1DRAFT_87245 [Neurospora tetrasperma FGSC 2508]|uniref:Uncharacterized protein n=2 Tax=Neurospora TaxID=5140 RepID=F8MWL2_NEUT8|nr:uncharacterized protein NEUTE1DRAFT_87245 [Neurospora tetrasperma FGSC 2508]EGO54133.1 hypothetical protein NEUTE1DRAFT_87245 [Neurospora tetrasperma FGSC 2508]EGZ68441.1 hypothetical protein NEUTE2DRAFT_160788 [Neurospora tetrasperma FGSC 2509]KAK3503974.1 hypothetical protein B0T13DRAFT_459137 [Neurospora crassa]